MLAAADSLFGNLNIKVALLQASEGMSIEKLRNENFYFIQFTVYPAFLPQIGVKQLTIKKKTIIVKS